MMRLPYFIFAALLTVASGVGSVSSAAAVSPQSAGAERFEVLSVKEARPALVNTVAALKKGDVAEAKIAFDAYDSAWNGVEVYINTRDKTVYSDLEQNYQAQIAKGLNSPNPDTTALLAQAQAMLAKYDEAISLVENGAPLNPLYDDVARLRIVRANLREVTLALRAGDFAKARKSFAAFDDKWDSIEDIVKARSADSYADIEKGMIQIEQALMPAKPDVDQVTALVKGVMDKYNAVVADVTKDARGH